MIRSVPGRTKAMELNDDVRKLADAANFATLTTLGRDGEPQSGLVWVGIDDGSLFVNTQVDRAKYRNVERNDRVSLVIIDADDPYHYAEVRGTATAVTGPDARRTIDDLSRKYTGEQYPEDQITAERVMLKITPTRQRVYS